jgi:hypothetical protein
MALTGGCPADAPEKTDPTPQVIRQEVEDKRQLDRSLEKIAAFKKYDWRDYGAATDMLFDADQQSKRQHKGFVPLTEHIGEVVGAAQDATKKGRDALVRDLAIKRFVEAADKIKGMDPFQVAMEEVPPELRPADGFKEARAQYQQFADDVRLARDLIRKLGLDQEKQAQTAPDR